MEVQPVRNGNIVELDVRDMLKKKIEPFSTIMNAIKSLQSGDKFILHATFNPKPLHSVLKKKGYSHEIEKLDSNHWRTTYYKEEEM